MATGTHPAEVKNKVQDMVSIVQDVKLFEHQDLAMSQLKRSLMAGNKRVMMQAPTGFGKTVLAGAIAKGARAKGNRILFVVPAISLIDQTVERFASQGITEVGVIQGQHPLTNYAAPVQVASVQTLMKRRLPEVDLVVIDEAHRWYKFYGKMMEDWNNLVFVGLSATPWTKGLGKYYQDLVIAATTQDLIDKGFLSKFRVFAPSQPDLSKVRTVAGDYHEGDLSEVMQDNGLTADIVSTWQKLGNNEPTLCFCVDRAHAKKVAAQFTGNGISAGYIDAYTDLEERQHIAKLFHNRDIQVVCNVGCLTTGVDWDVRCIVLARPTKSEMLFTQIIGRGLRTAEGKEECLILDHSSTHLNLGFVTDIHHEALDDGKPKSSKKKEKEPPKPKDCPSCGYLKAPKQHKCPMCGFAPQQISQIETEAGELEEINGKVKFTKEMKQEWYSMLKHIARERGYSDGWIANTYRSKTGVWPRSLSEASKTPSAEVRNYVKHLLIKYAKRKVA